MRYTIKWKFLLKFLVVTAVAAAGIFFLHRWQLDGQVKDFIRRADVAAGEAETHAKEGRDAEALAARRQEESFLRRYIAARPGEIEPRARLTRVLGDSALNPPLSKRQLQSAFYFAEDTLRRASDGRDGLPDETRKELHRLAARLAMPLELFSDAERHVAALLPKTVDPAAKLDPKYAEYFLLRARCLVGQKKYEAAEAAYRKAIEADGGLLAAHFQLAQVLRERLGKAEQADQAVRDMEEANKQNFRAHLLAAAYWREFGKLTDVDRAVKRAQALAPDEVDVLLAAADLSRIQARQARAAEVAARAQGKAGEEEKARAEAAAKVADARNLLNTALGKEQGRKNPGAYLLLAEVEADVRQLPAAVAAVERGLAELPDSTELLVALSEYQFQTGDRTGLAKTLEKLRSTDRATPPGVAEYLQARVFALDEDWGKAAAVLGKAIPLMAGSPKRAREANLLLARCYEQLGRHANRFAAYDAALNNPTPLD
ncbi:MAG TPA: hypothetical protein VM529_01550, partial [Gemmata sp.]|nr:hypothetical protein [Gemmata sp.]